MGQRPGKSLPFEAVLGLIGLLLMGLLKSLNVRKSLKKSPLSPIPKIPLFLNTYFILCHFVPFGAVVGFVVGTTLKEKTGIPGSLYP